MRRDLDGAANDAPSEAAPPSDQHERNDGATNVAPLVSPTASGCERGAGESLPAPPSREVQPTPPAGSAFRVVLRVGTTLPSAFARQRAGRLDHGPQDLGALGGVGRGCQRDGYLVVIVAESVLSRRLRAAPPGARAFRGAQQLRVASAKPRPAAVAIRALPAARDGAAIEGRQRVVASRPVIARFAVIPSQPRAARCPG